MQPPYDQNFLDFMQFFGNFDKSYVGAPLPELQEDPVSQAYVCSKVGGGRVGIQHHHMPHGIPSPLWLGGIASPSPQIWFLLIRSSLARGGVFFLHCHAVSFWQKFRPNIRLIPPPPRRLRLL